MKLHLLFAATVCVSLTAMPAMADVYPSKPIRLIVSNPPGGTVDLLPRILADKLRQRLGQPIVIENRAGAAGNLAAEVVFRAEPDGYTLLVSPPPALVINQNLYPKLAFDSTAFTPVSVMAKVPNALLVRQDFPAKNIAEFIAYAKARPGSVTYASQGNGSTSHLTAELFSTMSSTKMLHIPYKGSSPALNDLLGGQVNAMFDNLGASLEHVKGGKLKVLGVGSATRVPYLPDVQAISETLAGFEAVTWFGIVAPPKTPAAVVEKLSAAVADALRDEGVRSQVQKLSATPVGSTPAEMGAFMKSETAQWGGVIRSANVKID